MFAWQESAQAEHGSLQQLSAANRITGSPESTAKMAHHRQRLGVMGAETVLVVCQSGRHTENILCGRTVEVLAVCVFCN